MKNHGIATLIIVFAGLTSFLFFFSMLIGWNLVTLVIFWFFLTPILAIYLPILVLKKNTHLFYRMIGLILFYSLMIFMIYKQSATDYFKVMMYSGAVNTIILFLDSTFRSKKLKLS